MSAHVGSGWPAEGRLALTARGLVEHVPELQHAAPVQATWLHPASDSGPQAPCGGSPDSEEMDGAENQVWKQDQTGVYTAGLLNPLVWAPSGECT